MNRSLLEQRSDIGKGEFQWITVGGRLPARIDQPPAS
jgi:hypothetical protein